jgi:formiminoglutamase
VTVCTVIRGDGPIVLGQPHGGTFVPDDLMARLNANGRSLADTDWHITKLYDGLLPSATIVRSTIHRYVIDANRDPGGASLYPGQNTTSLCPVTDFDGKEIWKDGQTPSPDEIVSRTALYHTPYHATLQSELERVKALHGCAILFDCHSIRSDIPFLFDGTLPVFNIGTDGGLTCAAGIEDITHEICGVTSPTFDAVLNGRFKGGWTTRHYGQPARRQHAIQLEIAQRAYMQEAPPWTYLPDRADQIRPLLARILQDLDIFARSGALT